jgi:hypothetical protein
MGPEPALRIDYFLLNIKNLDTFSIADSGGICLDDFLAGAPVGTTLIKSTQ